MEYTESGQPNNASWSSPAEQKRQLSKHKGIATESVQQDETTADKSSLAANEKSVMQEATIWQRPEAGLPPEKRAPMPVAYPPQEAHLEALAPEKVVSNNPPDRLRQAVRSAYEEQVANTPAKEVALEQQPSVVGDTAWVDTHASTPNYNRNPDMPLMPRRPYFWTEPEVHPPRQAQPDHDVLPPVLHGTNPNTQPEETFIPEIPAVDPAFAEAVNPNIGHEPLAPAPEAPRAAEPAALEQPANPIASFARRTPDPMVESAPMPSSTPEQAPTPLSTANEPMPAGSLEYPVPFGPTAENFAAHSAGTEAAPTNTAELQEHTQRIETELSRTIFIDGLSIYDMFIAKDIDSEGLHHIITEYMQGGDFRNVALQEMARQQIRFERDPQMRHTPVAVPEVQQESSPLQLPAATTTPIGGPSLTERAERLAELTQGASDRVQDLVHSPHIGTIGSIVAIVAIYTAIIIIVLAK